jgi:hypothetical protein
MQRGSLSCWDAYPVPQSPLLRGDRDVEEWIEEPSAGSLRERASTPNRIDLDVDLARPARIAVNQNWHAGWRTTVGDVRRERGLLVVDLPAGHHDVTLRFVPRSAVGGALVSIASLAALVFLWQRGRVRWRIASIAASVPLVVFAACVALIPEARAEIPPLESPSGDALVADSLEQGSIRLASRFSGGVTLEAARLREPTPRAGQTVVLDVEWRREAKITSGLGVWVHIEPSEGDTLNGDHAGLSQTLLFDDAPPDKLLRDLLPITLPQSAGGKHWKIWVGLWRVQRGGARMHLLDAGSAIADGDGVLAAEFDVL